MRGYLIIKDGKAIQAAVATNAGCSTSNDFWLRAANNWIRRGAQDDGLYRAKFTVEDGYACVERGARVKSAKKEAERLTKLARKPIAQARTGSPGIQGYQQREDASFCAQLAARRANEDLAGWLKTLPDESGPNAKTKADLREALAALADETSEAREAGDGTSHLDRATAAINRALNRL